MSRGNEKVNKQDIIIAFMGPTGVGKSHFIDLLAQDGRQRAGGSYESVTARVESTRVKGRYGDRVVLVDTPGFDDAERTDMEILAMLGDWLATTYNRDVKLSGIVYLHRITDTRMSGARAKNLRMFGSLCGDNATHNAVLVTNMWEHLEDARDGERREKQLREVFWSGLIEHGSQVDRLRPGTPETAWRIIKKLVDRVFVDEEKKVVDEEKKVVDEEKKAITLLQEELVDLNRRLSETKAGKAIFTQLQRDLVKQQDEVKSLLARLEKSDNPALRKELEKERKRIEKELEDTFEDIKKLKIPIGRRLAIFFGKKSKAKEIKITAQPV